MTQNFDVDMCMEDDVDAPDRVDIDAMWIWKGTVKMGKMQRRKMRGRRRWWK